MVCSLLLQLVGAALVFCCR